MTELERRVAAAQATLDQFAGRPFRWGRADCARLVAAHLRRLGYRVQLPAAGSYASPRSAIKALAARGFASLGEALDALGLERIAPAAALPGDVVELPSIDRLGSLAIVLTNGRVVGFHQHAVGAAVLQPREWVAAWRARPVGAA